MKKLFDNLEIIVDMHNNKIPYKTIIEKLELNINSRKLYRWIKEFKHLNKFNIDSREDIKIYLNNRYIRDNRININSLKKNLYIIKLIDSYIDSQFNLNLNEKLHLILFDKNDSDIICKNCKKNRALFKSIFKGFKDYCSKKCSDSSKDRMTKIKKTKKELYGYETWNMNRVRKTVREKYGVDNISQNNKVRNKINNTIKKKYGVNNVMKLQYFKDKVIKTNRQRYKCDHALQNENIKNKTKYNNSFRYGVDYPIQQHIKHYNQWSNDKKFIEIYNELDSIEDITNYFNIKSLSTVYQRARKLNLYYKPHRKDVTIKKIGKVIESYGYKVEYNNRSIIKPLEIDIVIRKDNEIIKCLEYNGLMFHSIGLSNHKTFNNYHLYRNNLNKFIDKDRIKLDKCKDFDIELFILRENLYLNNNSIIEQWLNNNLNYKILNKPNIYRFKSMNNLETISIEEIESSIENGYRIYFDWIDIIY